MISARWKRRVFVLLFLTASFLLGSTVQEQLGVSFSLEGLQAFRQWVHDLGWWGLAVFILLVTFRLFIGLSSHLVRILGGLESASAVCLTKLKQLFRVARSQSARVARNRERGLHTKPPRLSPAQDCDSNGSTKRASVSKRACPTVNKHTANAIESEF